MDGEIRDGFSLTDGTSNGARRGIDEPAPRFARATLDRFFARLGAARQVVKPARLESRPAAQAEAIGELRLRDGLGQHAGCGIGRE